MLLILAFWTEGRWALTIAAANWLAPVIALGGTAWVVHHVVQGKDSWLSTTPWPAAGLPYLGPILMLLVAALVFRPKRAVEIWWLHGLGLMAIALGSSMADDSLFGVLVLVYLASGLWCLALFCLYREQQNVDGNPEQPRDRLAEPLVGGPTSHCPPQTVPWRVLGLGRVSRWTVTVVLLALLLFLATPRHARTNWQLAFARAAHMQTGLPGAVVDLNRVGVIEVSNDPAFDVSATDAAGKPKLDLDPQQRWRGLDVVFNEYRGGKWSTRLPKAEAPRGGSGFHSMLAIPEWNGQLPDRGPGQYFLTFTLSWHQARGVFLADPVFVGSDQSPPPVVTLEKDGSATSWRRTPIGGIQPPVQIVRTVMRYRQVAAPLSEPRLGRPFGATMSLDHYREMAIPDLAGLAAWTRELLDRLVAAGRLSQADLEEDPSRPYEKWLHPKNHEKVAQALEAHLLLSGEFGYSLDLRRQDWNIDPAEDFLRNTKRGHCERFATALALMLRSLGMPTRLVTGYRGWDSGEDGNYIVRHSHAHAWVEAIVRRRQGRAEKLHWLTLDPTPDQPAGRESNPWAGNWWAAWWDNTQLIWRNYIVEYNADHQEAFASDIWEQLGGDKIADGLSSSASPFAQLLHAWPAYGLGLSVVVVGCAGLWLVRRRRDARKQVPEPPRSPRVAFYAYLLEVLSRRCALRPRPAQTPREFAATATTVLQSCSPVRAFALVPEMVVQLYYRVRFGDRPLAEPERRSVDEEITQLDAALAAEDARSPISVAT